jgi:(1->4)-alpha-D-glucan 1-alpha-D-glucosylmutase
VEGTLSPDAADEAMIYQTIIGAWPLDLAADDAEGLAAYRDRLLGWLEKSLREAKRRSEWAAPNEVYENACREFLAACLDPQRSAITRELAEFAGRISRAGAINALSQTMLRLTAPGVPDLYQGAEFWDFALVDPDNRRPVDWAARGEALKSNEAPARLLAHWRDGRVKQAIIARALAFRGRAPSLFAEGAYQPLTVEGPRFDNVIAFARVHEGRAAIVAVTRLAAGLPPATQAPQDMPIVAKSAWDGTAIVVPRHLHGRHATDVLGGEEASDFQHGGIAARLPVADLLNALPVALLEVG